MVFRTMLTATTAEAVIVAVGSNVGNRANTIHAALRALETDTCRVRRTSFLYESSPMYVTDQPAFLNGAVQISTSLPPLQLLHKLKKIEHDLGRSPSGVRYGPRPIDLDIICYGERRIHDGDRLIVPHPRLHEREFVLRPMCDISESIPVPLETQTKTAKHLLQQLLPDGKSELQKVTPTHTGKLLRWGERTLLMGIINATPDSFSDGGQHNTIDAALRQVEKFVDNGFDVVDVGGQSTRPGAELIGATKELNRIMPIITAIRQSFPEILISCDTFLSRVAEQVLDAGADLINDISAGTLDATLHETLSNRNAACVQMHTRGTPATMNSLQQYSDVTADAARELSQSITHALDAGAKRWSVIADPGIGFAKDAEQCKRLLHETARFHELTGHYPMLLGVSRKSWLRSLQTPPRTTRARDWATAGALGALVAQGGAKPYMTRVHEAEVADAVRAADAIARG